MVIFNNNNYITTTSISNDQMDTIKRLKSFLETLIKLARNIPDKYTLVRILIQDLLVSYSRNQEKKFKI